MDRFEARGLPIFGPATDPARIEGSKAFAKELMVQYGIPTGQFLAIKFSNSFTFMRRARFKELLTVALSLHKLS